MATAALGVRAHCGWAVLVAVGGGVNTPELQLHDGGRRSTTPSLAEQLYRAATGLGLDEPGELICPWRSASRRRPDAT
ncbi:hypothetical protein C1J01_30105 [Nonomuraea aridisoli]|uniref:Uncharacterized protein n=1 Tax=Nonomuraea aridisoli TaxID=2070368 RepID=A0A2W2DS13_9ACTN|nr:hypothetical protein C1J01_30105 [Nonomuraea aridisoli]